MSVVNSHVYLISTLPEQTSKFLDELLLAQMELEVLNPEELDKSWDKLKYLNAKYEDKENELEELQQIVTYFNNEKGIFSSLVDSRPSATLEEILLIKRNEEQLLEAKNLVIEFIRIEQESEDISKKVSKINDKSVLVLGKVEGFDAKFKKFIEKEVHEFNLEHEDTILEIEYPQYEIRKLNNDKALIICNKNSADSLIAYTQRNPESELFALEEYLELMRQKEEKIELDLIEYGINLDGDNLNWVNNFVLLHAFYELDKIRSQALRHCFELDNGPAIFMFVAVDPRSLDKFHQLINKYELPVQKVDWTKPIVNWKTDINLQPFQNVAKSLGTIDRNETDPTWLITFFFALFFAFCLGDALYGLIISIFTGYFLYLTNLKPQFKGIFRLFFWSGLATVIFGAITNSWAGDLLAKTSLKSITDSLQIINPLDQNANAPVNNFLRENGNLSPIVALMGIAIVIGLANILIAYSLKVIGSFKSGNRQAFKQDAVWLGFLVSIIIWLTSIALAPSMQTIALASIGFFFISLFITANGKSLVSKLLGGFGSVYNLISFFADIMSYTRLVAVGLTSGIIASVINLLAQLIYDSSSSIPVVGIILAAAVLIGGHLFNLVISLFGAYINPLRLHYVEFLPKFYEGRGRSLQPVYSNFTLLNITK